MPWAGPQGVAQQGQRATQRAACPAGRAVGPEQGADRFTGMGAAIHGQIQEEGQGLARRKGNRQGTVLHHRRTQTLHAQPAHAVILLTLFTRGGAMLVAER